MCTLLSDTKLFPGYTGSGRPQRPIGVQLSCSSPLSTRLSSVQQEALVAKSYISSCWGWSLYRRLACHGRRLCAFCSRSFICVIWQHYTHRPCCPCEGDFPLLPVSDLTGSVQKSFPIEGCCVWSRCRCAGRPIHRRQVAFQAAFMCPRTPTHRPLVIQALRSQEVAVSSRQQKRYKQQH